MPTLMVQTRHQVATTIRAKRQVEHLMSLSQACLQASSRQSRSDWCTRNFLFWSRCYILILVFSTAPSLRSCTDVNAYQQTWYKRRFYLSSMAIRAEQKTAVHMGSMQNHQEDGQQDDWRTFVRNCWDLVEVWKPSHTLAGTGIPSCQCGACGLILCANWIAAFDLSCDTTSTASAWAVAKFCFKSNCSVHHSQRAEK